jgi:cytochrome c-type biogenesis protein
MNTLAVAAAFGAGLSTSVGPCVAPRYLALTAITAHTRGRSRYLRVVCFVAGLLACYALLGTAASLIGQVEVFSRVIYLALAAAFLGFGLHALLVRRSCAHSARRQPLGGIALASGGALGLVLSPCCSPVVAIIASVGLSPGSIATSLTGALAFAAGHLAPLATIGLGVGASERLTGIRALSGAGSTVSGGLALALAAYYGLLA